MDCPFRVVSRRASRDWRGTADGYRPQNQVNQTADVRFINLRGRSTDPPLDTYIDGQFYETLALGRVSPLHTVSAGERVLGFKEHNGSQQWVYNAPVVLKACWITTLRCYTNYCEVLTD